MTKFILQKAHSLIVKAKIMKIPWKTDFLHKLCNLTFCYEHLSWLLWALVWSSLLKMIYWDEMKLNYATMNTNALIWVVIEFEISTVKNKMRSKVSLTFFPKTLYIDDWYELLGPKLIYLYQKQQLKHRTQWWNPLIQTPF